MKKFILFFPLAVLFFNAFGQQSLDNEKLLDMIQSQRYGEAADYLKSFYPGQITDDKVNARLGYLYYLNGNLPQAEQSYLNLLKKDSTNINSILNLASIQNKRGNYTVAADYYKRVINIDSTIFNVYKQLASIARLSNITDSMRIYYLIKANTLNPIDPDVAFDLSNGLIQYRQYKQADSVLDIAIKADTTNLLLYHAKVDILNRRGLFKELIPICNRLLERKDSASVVLRALGSAYYRLNDFQKSLDYFLLLEKNGPISDSYLYLIGKCYMALNNEKKALQYLEEAINRSISISPSIAQYYYEAGNAYKNSNQADKALADYLKGLEYSSEFYTPPILYATALLYDQHYKNKASSIKYYKKFIASVGGNGPLSSKYKAMEDHFTFSKARVLQLTSPAATAAK